MHRRVKEFIKLSSETLRIDEPIYEFGSRQMPGQEGYANLRPYFPEREYVGTDYIDGPGVDLVLDVRKIDLPSNSIGTILCTEVLEHVEQPFDAVNEMFRVLKPNGILIITSPMNLRIHGSPYDYWRFTPEGFKTLLKAFPYSFVGFAGDEEFPDTIVGFGIKGSLEFDLTNFESAFKIWQKKWSYPSTNRIRKMKNILTPFLPPLLLGSNLELWKRSDKRSTTSFLRLLVPEFMRFRKIVSRFK